MEPVAIASAAMANSQAQIGAAAAQKMMKMNHEAAQQLVAMIDQATANSVALAAAQSIGSATGPGIGTRIDRQA